jgi:hypothetical protein
MSLARPFKAGMVGSRIPSRQRRLKDSIVADATKVFGRCVIPALKDWAKFNRRSATGRHRAVLSNEAAGDKSENQ